MEKHPSHSLGKEREVHLFALGRHGEAVIANHVLNKCVGVRVRRREDERAYTHKTKTSSSYTKAILLLLLLFPPPPPLKFSLPFT